MAVTGTPFPTVAGMTTFPDLGEASVMVASPFSTT
jgi:hypothetical protein